MLHHKSKYLIAFLLVSWVLNNPTHAQEEIKGQNGKGSAPVSVTVAEMEKWEKEGLPDPIPRVRFLKDTRNPNKQQNPDALPGNRFPAGSSMEIMPLNITQSIHSNFQGIQLSESGSIPPDCMGGVSHTQLCVLANGRIKFYNKPNVCNTAVTTSTTTNEGSLTNPVFSTSLRVFFNSVLGGFDVTDPHVYFDRLTERWFIVAINTANASNRIVIAVSNSSQVTAQSSFSFYFIVHDEGAPANSPDRGGFFDYPMPGLDRHALYIGGIIFDANNRYGGSSVVVVNKNSLLGGGNVQFTAFRQVGTSSSGIFAPQGVFNDDPEATRGFFVGTNWNVYSRINFITINNPGSNNPTATNSTVNVPNYFFGYPQPALGSTVPLDALGDERLLDAQMIRNKITNTHTLWTAHTTPVTATGNAVNASGVAGARNAMRWYQFTENNGNITLTQSGTLFDNATTNPLGFWMGSIAGTGQGHAVLAASEAGSQRHANVIVSGRYAGQSLGVLNPKVSATNFAAVYNRTTTGNTQRWGDYSMTVVDPSDDMTVWTFQQYANSPNSWGVRAIQLKAPPPATPVSVDPISCGSDRNAIITLNGQADNFSGFFDPGPPRGAPATQIRLSVTSTGNVSVSNVEFLSPTRIRFQANFSNATLGSQQTLTITNPDCQQVTFRYTLPTECSGNPVTPPLIFTVIENPPRGGMMQVQVPEGTGTLRMIASDGKIVGNWQVTNTLMRIPVGNLAGGVYFLEHFGAGSSSPKVVRVLIQ
jgi:hypothetical protein